MALKYDSTYSATGTDDTDVNYPGGKGVNASSESALDGFPAKAERSNDLLGFLQSLIVKGSRGRVTTKTQYDAEVSGSADNAFTSDYNDGLQNIINPIHPDVSEYSASTDYVFGNLVQFYGSQYLCLVANGPASSVQNPIADVYGDYWYELPSENWMRQQAQVIRPFMLGIKPVFDYNDASYEMVFPFGIFRKGNQKIEYFCVLHDDSNVISSGNIAYEAMGTGSKGTTIASFSGGDYTMIDGQDCVLSAMGDNRPASFGRQEDGVQKFRVPSLISVNDTDLAARSTIYEREVYSTTVGGLSLAASGTTGIKGIPFDDDGEIKSADGETRVKSLLGGPLGQIVAEVTAI